MPNRGTSVQVAVLLAGSVVLSTPASADSDDGPFKKTVYEAEKQQKLKLGGTVEYEYKLELTSSLAEPECRADVSISYLPMYDKVRVDTTVEHDGCAASSGDYRIEVRTRGADGEVAADTVHESWTRTEAADFETSKDYPLDVSRQLIDVRVRTASKTNCRCDTPVEGAEASPGGPP